MNKVIKYVFIVLLLLIINFCVVKVEAGYFSPVTEGSVTDPTDFDYTIALVGDTQTINRDRPEHMKTIYDYIVENVEDKNIVHVAGMGDITDQSGAREYETALEQFRRLDGLVSYSLQRGNHDTTITYEKYLGVSATYCGYSSQYKEYFINSANTVHEFSAGNLDYLLLTLDFGPSDEVLEWANGVVAAHPYHNVIISTHGYLDENGNLIRKSSSSSNTGLGGYNNGTDIWDKLVSKHENIVMVVCGHTAVDDVVVRKTEGIHGNTVTQILVDTQYTDRDDIKVGGDGLGVVTMMYFSNGGKTIDLRYYATIKEGYHGKQNQFRMEVDVVQRKLDAVNDGISKLPDSVGLENQDDVNKLYNLYLSLSEEEKASIDVTKLVQALNQIDVCKANLFDQKVLELPEVITLEDSEEMLALRDEYRNSTDFFKQNVKQLELYEKKYSEFVVLVSMQNAPIINKEILHLPYPLTLNDKNLVEDLRNRYEELDETSKKKVTFISKLVEAETIISILSEQYEKALLVDEMITNLPKTIDLSCEEEVLYVRQEYIKLDSVAKEYVTKLDVLEKAEKTIFDAHLMKNAKTLNEMILSLPDDITLSDKGIIESIRNRYDALDEESRKYVSELFLLETFEARIRILEQIKAKVDLLNDKVDALPSNITPNDKELVEGLLEEYRKLTKEEKQFFTKMDKLNTSLAALNQENSDGCNGSVIPSILGLVLLACSVFVLQRQKKLRKDNWQ